MAKSTNSPAEENQALARVAVAKAVALELAEKYGVTDSGVVDTSALTPPFLSIAQGLSPELNPAEAGHIPDLKMGQFFIKGQALGDSLETILCYASQEYVEWTPSRQFVAKYPITSTRINECKKGTGKDQYKDFTPEGNQLVKTYNLFLLVKLPEGWKPLIFAAKATQYKPAAELHSAAGHPSFAKKLRLRTVSKSNDQGTWFIFGHQVLDEVPTEEEMTLAAEVAKLASAGSMTTNHADSAYSATSYDNSQAVYKNMIDAAVEAMAATLT